MKSKLNKAQMESFLPHIKEAIKSGKRWEDKNMHFPAGLAIDAVLTIPGISIQPTDESDNGFETNGWDYDWWQHFEFNGHEYVLCGSGFYGGLCFYDAD